MSQAGYTPISLYYSTTAAAVPVNTNLANGELAINITDGKLYYKDNGGTVRLLASNATSAPVLSFQTSLSGLTPSTATTGVVTLAGTLGVASGGTGLTTLATGSLTYGAGTSAFSALAIGTAGQILTVNSGATAPQWSTLSGVAVTTFSAGTTGFTPSSATAGAVTLAGTLATTNGGTGLTSFTSGGVVYASSTSALATGVALSFDSTNTRFGVGTNAPVATLQANKADGGYVFGLSGTTKGLRVATDATQTSIQGVDNTLGVSFQPLQIGGSYLSFAYSGTTEGMRLTSTGLGIGTSSPAYKLDVNTTADSFFNGIQVRNLSAGSSATSSYALGQDTNATAASIFINSSTNTNFGGANSLNIYQGLTAPLVFYTAATARMRLDSAGNLGLGVTPSTWTSVKAIEIGELGSAFAGGGNNSLMFYNSYFNSGFKYARTGIQASYYQQTAGTHVWTTAASGTAGNAITFTQAMTLDASGNLGIGTTSPGAKLDVVAGAFTDVNARISTGTSTVGNYVRLTFSEGAGATTLGWVNSWGSAMGAGLDSGMEVWNNRSSFLRFGTNNTERVRIDSAGTFIIKNDYQETTYTANSSTAITLNIVTNGTDQVITLTGNATITMPTATAGKSFLLKLKTGAGGYTVTWSTVKWPSGTAPTLTSTASRMDIFSFFADGTNWYGCTVGQNYTP